MDTSVLVSAIRSNMGASYRFLELVKLRQFQLFASTSLILEYESVLLRSEHTTLIGVSSAQNLAALDDLLLYVDPVGIDMRIRPQLRDPNDDHVLEAAVNASVYAIVTHNVRDFLPEALRHGVRVERPGAIIKLEANR